MSDPRFLQSGFWPQLAHVVEEAGEVLAAAGKTQRWGALSFNPDLPEAERETNIAWLWRELGDLENAIGRLAATIRADHPELPFDPRHPEGPTVAEANGRHEAHLAEKSGGAS